MGLFSNKTSQLHQHQQHHLNFQQPQHSEYIYNTSYQNDQQTTDRTAEAPYQMSGKRGLKSILGHKELARGRFWLSVLSECLSCYIYVFIVCSTRISWTGSIIGHEPNLLAMALASGLAMMLLIFTFKTVHVNPALTLSFLLTGRISLVRALFYLIAHCFGSIAAVAFLYSISIKGHAGALGLDSPHDVLTDWQILIVEFVITFIVTLATYATCNYSSYTNAKRSILKESAVYESITSKSDHSQHHQKPIEEVMRDECQLLAPNGFALHMSSGQAMVIGFAYILASLSGIPASGASLNPARSLGPAFIMNHWDRHWIYWVGPISGAIVAGFFYEFIFNPTRKLSLCYRPKLFRFSAQDMARVGSKSRVYQQQQKFTNQPTTTLFRPQSYHQTMNHSPSTRSTSNNLITSPTLLNLTRDPQSITTSTSVAHLQSSFPISNTFDQISYLQQQQQHQPLHNHQPNLSANFDRCKSTAIINTISGNNANLQPHQSTINLPSNRNNNLDLGKFMSNNTSGLDHQQNHMDFLFVNNSKPTYSEL